MAQCLRTRLIVLVVSCGFTGCSDTVRSPIAASPSAPSSSVSPTTTPAPAASAVFAPNVTLSGVVSEITQDVQVPIEGVSVYCEPCGEGTHTFAYTDDKGFYSFTGVWGTDFSIWVTKDGYRDPPGMPTNKGFPSGPGWRDVRVVGDTRFDVQLARK